MGRKKGKQAGAFDSKAQNRQYRLTLRERTEEAEKFYRNPVTSGYHRDCAQQKLNTNGHCPRDDKWSAIFKKTRAQETSPPERAGRRVSLHHLRALLSERQLEDRTLSRQERLRIYRSRLSTIQPDVHASKTICDERHQPGWMLYQEHKDEDDEPAVPSLQTLAARCLGRLLPFYVASCGQHFVAESLMSVSSQIMTEISVSLAEHGVLLTDGVVQCLAGCAEGLVLDGSSQGCEENPGDDSTQPLSDAGFLSLCPRIQPESSIDCWEGIDYECASSTGCFHLRRLELIDCQISFEALHTVLRCCSNLTHLGLSGCFNDLPDALHFDFLNGNDIPPARVINDVLTGIAADNGETETTRLLRQLLFLSQKDVRERETYSEAVSCFVGLHEILPDLRVLDISECTWVTSMVIVQFILNHEIFRSKREAQLNVRGCGISEALLGEWKSCAVFDMISTERQLRSQR